ncbi:hypothetical protein D8674_026105 [Pyrus ussuriensis x Pyrus communis]|uniref:Uncharacterized protein n=1 Tax=Pyrus ussuriensis x Pyrus communis TaxID=2448454 RepID=A0A5N5IAI3_9ROSA|nr:hypothetical protein D8674_026105 [Pyrus ussuriensis x Pyrus communis]
MALLRWQRSSLDNTRKEIGVVRDKLGVLFEQPHMDHEQDSLLSREETYWRQHSQATWLRDGDRNTKWFHRRSSNRKQNNHIKRLRDVAEGVLPNALHFVTDVVEPCITFEMNEILMASITAEKIRSFGIMIKGLFLVKSAYNMALERCTPVDLMASSSSNGGAYHGLWHICEYDKGVGAEGFMVAGTWHFEGCLSMTQVELLAVREGSSLHLSLIFFECRLRQILLKLLRPDLAYAVSWLSRYTSNQAQKHWDALVRVLRYLKNTLDYGLHYTKYPPVVEGFSDANWISSIIESKSTSGYVYTLGGAAISWKSSKQKCIARSTMESKFIVLDLAGEEVEWLKHFLEDIPV